MKKKYTQPILQYDLNGNLIKEWENISSIPPISRRDSIINCCLNKTKTSAGFIWRFKGDSFNSNPNPKSNIKCKICNSSESVRSMAMHLKWAHNLSTQEYVKDYGEYRPKNLKNLKKQETSNLKCFICNEKLNHNQHLMYHITKKHPDITQSEYIIKYMFYDSYPLCKCGCGQPVKLLRSGKNSDLGKDSYSRDYIKGHWDWEVFTNINKQSKEEINLLNYIKSIYKGEIKENVRGIIPKNEIDIFLPQLKLAIEYNGLYWHSEKANRLKDYHINKLKQATLKGIRLIQIFSDEWLNHQEIVKSKLKNILNLATDRIYARNCIIQEITNPQIKNNFLNQYHIQGEDRSKIKLGLFHENNLVGVMTFSNPRVALGSRNLHQDGTYELSRFASSINIIGGASKLLKYFIKKYTPNTIYSYSDNRWTDPDNNMYLKLGFEKSSQSSPNYFYTKNFLTRSHRYSFNKFKLKKMGCDVSKTEKDLMKELGYTRIWDCGTTKYVLNIKRPSES